MNATDAPKPPDPIRRFYKAARVEDGADGTARILLDERPIRTPARAHLSAPRPIAERIAAEWNAQETYILPITMPMTRLANTAIDGVASALEAVKDDIAAMADSDLVMYRADTPAGLVEAQETHWNPVVDHAERGLGLRINLVAGIMPVRQDARLPAAVRERLPHEALPLAAFHQLTTLTGSALTTLAYLERAVDFDDAWTAAHVDEDWNIREWGEDAEAAARRAQRRRDAEAAAFVLRAEGLAAQ